MILVNFPHIRRRGLLCGAPSRSILWGLFLLACLPDRVIAQSSAKVFTPVMLAHDGDASKVAVVMWAAFGSGCKAAEEMAAKDRDIGFQVLPRNAARTPKLVLDLSFPQFSLKNGRQEEKGQAVEMYSECALRFGIRGQPGLRLKKIEGLAQMDIQKDKGASILLVNEIKFGQFGGDEKKFEYGADTEVKKTRVDLNLAKDLALYRSDGKSSCGTDQLLFYDFTLFAKKSNKASHVTITMAPPKHAKIRLEYESC